MLFYKKDDYIVINQLFGVRFYSGDRLNMVEYINYKSKNKLNNKNLFKIQDYLKNSELVGADNNLKLLESRLKNEKFYIDYVLIESINNINYDDEFIYTFYNNIDNDNIMDVRHNNNVQSDVVNREAVPTVPTVPTVESEVMMYKIKFINILNQLNKNCIYKLIFRWKSVDVDNFGNYNPQFSTSPSFFIYNGMDINSLLYRFINNLNVITTKYNIVENIRLDIFIKDWITYDEFKSFDQIIDTLKKSDIKYVKDKINNGKNVLIKNGFFGNDLINNNRKIYLCLNVNGLDYGQIISKEDINKNNLLTKINLEADVILYKKIINKNIYLIKVEQGDVVSKTNVKIVSVYLWKNVINLDLNIDINLLLLEKWRDTISYFIEDDKEMSCVNRISENTGYYVKFINDKLINVDLIYNSKKLLSSYNDFDKDENIGVIDIETYNNFKGEANAYCIGIKTNDLLYTLYIDDYINSDDMILDFINNICISKYHNIKLYAHNMSEFDGILILKSLIKTSHKHDYKINIFSDNEGKIMSIDIKKKIKNKKIIKITILDSYLLLPVNLNNLCEIFNTDVIKSVFPYNFVNENTLNYKGSVPNYTYFNKLSIDEYLKYSASYSIWETKNETINYLTKDLFSLYEVITKFNLFIYNKFKINITRVRTISGLSFLIFTSKFYDENKTPIYYTKGKLEKFIRKAYIGGIVDVNTLYTDYTTFKYDVNSHYPNAMKCPMPGGLPKISSEKNLDNIFGFVEAIVEAPSKKELECAILPVKIDDRTILFRNTVKGVWWSEELKMARDYGYKIHEILSCVQFEKVYGTYDKYVDEIYQLKSKAELKHNTVERYLYKLLLNSLYGRMGLRQTNIKLSIIEEDKLSKILHTEISEVLFKENKLALVKSSGPLNPEIVKIINEEKLYDSNLNKFNLPNSWGANKSSVQYSAAITAYARMFLNPLKNMENNKYIGGDTDSVIMSKPLDNKFIGKNLGQFKLEYVITEGFYHSKKFYLLVTNENKIIIKAKGIGNSVNVLNYQAFIELFSGNSIKIKQIQFNKDYKTLDIKISYIEKEIKGILDPNINYKIKNRKLIVYNKYD